ncbi:uncharacterized protein LOC111059543 [Nilaparvata lugens]|uniref:uncharacterized protein LOC111059543 n=1 Tax=Nilaparvata lugens TaxID=108931 RepID=UPI00193C9E1A|nr:uncharacterized protein LOC111059543 [Nilaparvata lugens]
MDTESLIMLIQERESLWNQKSEYYHSRDVQRRLWNEVAQESKIKVEEVKKKWRGIRDIFRREFKRANAHKSGDPGEDYIPKWPYYKIMLFLKDTITSRDLTGSVPSEVDERDESELDVLSEFPPENDIATSPQISSPSTQTKIPSRTVFKSPPKKASKRPKETSTIDDKLLKIEEEKLKLFKGNMADSEMQFLMSLYPFLKRVPPARQLAVRASIIRVIDDENTQQYSPSPSFHSSSADECRSHSSSSSMNYMVLQNATSSNQQGLQTYFEDFDPTKVHL